MCPEVEWFIIEQSVVSNDAQFYKHCRKTLTYPLNRHCGDIFRNGVFNYRSSKVNV